jgi:hypothetical protein
MWHTVHASSVMVSMTYEASRYWSASPTVDNTLRLEDKKPEDDKDIGDIA